MQKPHNQTDTTVRVSQYLQMQRFLAGATLCKLITPSVNMILGSEILCLHPKQFQALRNCLEFGWYLQNSKKVLVRKIHFCKKLVGTNPNRPNTFRWACSVISNEESILLHYFDCNLLLDYLISEIIKISIHFYCLEN